MMGLISSRSSVVHKPFSLFLSCQRLLARLGVRPRGRVRIRSSAEVFEQCRRVWFTIEPERPPECPARKGCLVGLDRRCEPRSPPRHDCLWIRHNTTVDHDDAKESGSGDATATADARSDGFHSTPCTHPWRSRHSAAGPLTANGVSAPTLQTVRRTRPMASVVEDRVRLNIDPGTGQLGCQPRILPFLADRQRELVVGDQRTNSLGSRVKHE